MAKIVFTQDELDAYLSGDLIHCFLKDSVEIADKMAVHADGIFPARLLSERRPNEPHDVFLYRKLIYVPITKPTFSKIFSSLQKIRRSDDFVIKYKDQEKFPKIVDGEDLECYCEDDFPFFGSVTNWAFTIMLRKYLIDPNAVVFEFPSETDVEETGYLEPFPAIFASTHVVFYKEQDFCVLKNPEPIYYKTADGKQKEGDSYYIINTIKILRYDQSDSDNNYSLVQEYEHGLGYMPCRKLGGVLIDESAQQFLYESRISAIIPELDEAVREYSDLQAAKVMHIYPERWEYTNSECPKCKARGRIINPLFTEDCNCPQEINCPDCDGRGYQSPSPYKKIMIKPADPLNPQATPPMPPAGFIEKDVEIIKIMQTGVDQHIQNALGAINFEFLGETPMNESGIAKAVDQDELNNTVHSIAEDVVDIIKWVNKTSAYYRYSGVYPQDEIDDMLPEIPVPTTFDLISAQTLESELVLSKKNSANPLILNALEIDYADKRFTDKDIRDTLILTLELDPLPNTDELDKVQMLQNEGITQKTYVISSNIVEFVQRAMDENDGTNKTEVFAEMDLSEQKAILLTYAQDQIANIQTAKQKARSTFLATGGNGLDQSRANDLLPNNLNSDNANNGANNLQPDSSGNNGRFNNIPNPNT